MSMYTYAPITQIQQFSMFWQFYFIYLPHPTPTILTFFLFSLYLDILKQTPDIIELHLVE